jgi:hypothetical protein
MAEMKPDNDCRVCPCVGYAFVPYQILGTTYTPEKALLEATLFPELRLTIDEYGKVCKQEGVH